MNRIKRILLAVLGEKKYLSLLANSFQRIFKLNLLGLNYQDNYFLKEIVKEGNYCADIGAHLGYYTLELSALVKGSGKVIAIEPMSKFNSVLKKLLEKNNVDNVELLKVALGGEGDYVEMGIPKINNMKKFAYARVIKSNAGLKFLETEKVKNENGDTLFENLPRLDFIKCDVEGLEVTVFSSMLGTLEKHHPIILCELADREERIKLYEILMHLGYQAYLLREKELHLFDVYLDTKAISHNHYFLTPDHEEQLRHLISR